MVPAKPTVCHRVVNFVWTVEHGEGTRQGVERSVNTLVARWRPVKAGESFGQAQNISSGGYKWWHTVRTRYMYEDGKMTWARYEAVMEPFVGRCPYCTV